jgi:hypothetical protein
VLMVGADTEIPSRGRIAESVEQPAAHCRYAASAWSAWVPEEMALILAPGVKAL